MKIKNIIVFIAIGLIAFNSCNRDEIFNREQHKTTVGIKSSGAYNIFEQIFQYSDIEAAEEKQEWIKGSISVNVGGALETDRPIVLEFVVDESLVENYNKNNYFTDSYKYAQMLPRDRYQIENYSVVIPAGQRNTNVEIFLRLDGLTNDTVYFLPLRIASSSSYELIQNKSTVLFRPRFRNKFVETADNVSYRQIAQWARYSAPLVYYDANVSKQVYPISSNKIRFYVGKLPWVAADVNTKNIFQKSITLTIADQPDDKGQYQVEFDSYDLPERGVRWRLVDEGTGPFEEFYNNKYELWFDGFENYYHTFRLYYEYWDNVTEGTAQWIRIKEELRIQHQIKIPK